MSTRAEYLRVRRRSLILLRQSWARWAREEWLKFRAEPRGSGMGEHYWAMYREARARAQVYRDILRGELG